MEARTQPSAVLMQRRLGVDVYGWMARHLYDRLVLGVSNRLAWGCPADRLLTHYRENVTANHLDVGVGTGFFLDRVTFPSRTPRVGLLDANVGCLADASGRLERYSPLIYSADLLAPIDLPVRQFDSIGINYVLHCLPGPMDRKAVAFDHLLPLLRPGGVLFGATLLARRPHLAPQTRFLMNLYNAMGIFGNGQDGEEELRAALSERFLDVKVEVRGAAALFSARARA
jgi:SAM-dependent methyltransferase